MTPHTDATLTGTRTWDGFPTDLLLGSAAFDGAGGAELADDVAAYIAAVICARGYPLHTTLAFNALHWGYNDQHQAYEQPALALLDTAPQVVVGPGGPVESLPVGVIFWLQVGNSDPLWVELAGKDGRSPLPDHAPSEFNERESTEAWIIDPRLFGPDERAERKLDNWQTAEAIAPHWQLLLDVADQADHLQREAEVGRYVRWMVEHAAVAFAKGPLGQGLIETPDPDTRSGRERIEAGLMASLTALEDALDRSPALRRWGDYWMLAAWIDDVDQRPNVPFGRADLASIVARLARGDSSRSWRALGPPIEDLASTLMQTERRSKGGRNLVGDPLAGPAWLRRHAVSARWIADRLVETNGVVNFAQGARYLRCDDLWPRGSSWLSANPPPHDSTLWGYPPDQPLHLATADADIVNGLLAGDAAAETRDDSLSQPVQLPDDEPQVGATDEPAEQDQGAASPHDPEHAEGDVSALEDSVVELTTTLRARDIDGGALPLPDRFDWLAELVADQNFAFLTLAHDGELDDDQAHQVIREADGLELRGVSWPIDFTVGIRLHLAAVRNTPTLYATARVISDGAGTYVVDPLASNTPDTGHRLTLAALALDALRRVGRETYGTRRATARQLSQTLFGPDCHDLLRQTVQHALDELVAQHKLAKYGTEFSLSDHSPDPTRLRITPPGRGSGVIQPHEVRAHWVSGMLRQLPPGHFASDTQRWLYRERYDRDLPSGFTWVRPHRRGESLDAWRDALKGTHTAAGPLPDEARELLIHHTFWRSA